MEKQKSGLATAGLVLGIIGICISFIPIVNNASFVLGILAIVFSITPLVKKKSKGKAIVAIILGILSIFITLSLQKSWSDSFDDMDGTNTEKVLKQVDIDMGNFEVETDEYGLNETKLTVKITNKTNETKSFSFKIEAVDENGNRISDDTIYANDLTSGQSQNFDIFEYVESEKIDAMKNAKFNIIEASMY